MRDKPHRFRVATLLGTARPGNFTGKALALVEDELRSLGAEVRRFDPAKMNLGFPGQETTDDARQMQQVLDEIDGVVLSTPEYHGSVSSMLKLMIENMGFPSKLAGKPIALLGVAAGRIGAIKSLEQLRGTCSHVGGLVLPAPVSIAGVQKVFDEQGHCLDEDVEKQIRSVASNLIDYLDRYVCPRMTLEAMVRERSD